MNRNREFVPSGLVVLRTPLLPMEEIEAWSAGLLSPGRPGDEEALRHDRALLRRRLRDLLERPEVREALFLASPDLVESLAQWQRDPESKKGLRTELGLTRYFLRMASRPTPFGLFSGCTSGTVGDKTRLDLAGSRGYRRHSRLDMDYLFALCEHLAQNREIRPGLLYRPNTSLYEAAGRLRYAEARVNGRLRTYHLVAVDSFDALQETVERARDGARLQDLAEALVDAEITLEDALEFIHDLVDNQILVPDLALPVTGEESTPALVRQLAGLHPEAGDRLARAERELAGIDTMELGSDPAVYRAIAGELEPLGVPVELSRLFQVDMVKPAQEVTLGPDLIDEVLRGVDLLHRLTQTWREGAMEDFRNAFRERYGEGREMPLLEVLDEESGIGYERSNRAAAEASPLLDGLSFRPRVERFQAPWTTREMAMLGLISRAQGRGEIETVLSEEDVEQLTAFDRRPLPDAFHVKMALAAESPEAAASGDCRLFLDHAAGPSGARVLGRFCHADLMLHAGVAAHLEAEEAHRPDAIFAEVVHLPAGRVGNVLSRPVLRSHEITFLGNSGARPERQIPVQDLLVTVLGDRVRLRSKRLGREVVPRLSTAHVPIQGLGVYRFLWGMQGYDRATPAQWSWGPLEAAPFLPRISYGRLVLSRARWRVAESEIKPLASTAGAERFRRARAWREERRMPRYVALVDGDNELILDFDNPLNLDAVVELIKSRRQATFTEVYPAPGELCARGPEGRFFHEIVMPFVRRPAERPQSVAPPRVEASPGIRRSFPPGSEWLFAKIYTGTGTADQVLRDEIAPLAREAMAAGHARSWFFIRYSDPEWHLRVRFRGEPGRLREAVLPALGDAFERLLGSGMAWKCQLDTYEREVERYGGDEGIELSEALFHHDSEAVAEMLDFLAADAGAGAALRWRLILLGMDRLMEDFGLDLETRLRLAERARAGFGARYEQDALRGPLADRLRRERAGLERLLALREDGPEEILPGLKALARRSEALRETVQELRARERQGRLKGAVGDILTSYLHMFVNRLSRSAGPEHEAVLYDFLAQIYSSLRARAAKASQPRRAAVGA